jgi:vacuolar-type H+-ATPase subunit H
MTDRSDPISEIEQLIDELESFAEKSPWYLPNKIAIHEDDFFRITSRIRELLPAELAEARATLTKRDLILKNAQEEHRRILDSAERRLQDLTSEDQIVVVARQEAERIIESAQRAAEELKRDALLYTIELLDDMEEQFNQTTASIQKGREFLQREISEQVEQNLTAVETGAIENVTPAGPSAGD